MITKLALIQQEVCAPKNQYNSYGKYNYRSCEDILEGLTKTIFINVVAPNNPTPTPQPTRPTVNYSTNNNLKEFVLKMGMQDTSQIPDKIEIPETNINYEELFLGK